MPVRQRLVQVPPSRHLSDHEAAAAWLWGPVAVRCALCSASTTARAACARTAVLSRCSKRQHLPLLTRYAQLAQLAA